MSLQQWHDDHDAFVAAGVDRDDAVKRADECELRRHPEVLDWSPGNQQNNMPFLLAQGLHRSGLAAAVERAEAKANWLAP